MINEQLELVSEFHTLFEQPILNKEDEISVERRKLRLALLLEELSELAEAYGLDSTFNEMLDGQVYRKLLLSENPNNVYILKDTNILNKKEVLDATGDLAYILAGTILENGQQNEFDEAFEDIHKSNISKLCRDKEEVDLTIEDYKSKNIEVFSKALSNGYIGIYRKLDNKILKSINYIPVDLNKYI